MEFDQKNIVTAGVGVGVAALTWFVVIPKIREGMVDRTVGDTETKQALGLFSAMGLTSWYDRKDIDAILLIGQNITNFAKVKIRYKSKYNRNLIDDLQDALDSRLNEFLNVVENNGGELVVLFETGAQVFARKEQNVEFFPKAWFTMTKPTKLKGRYIKKHIPSWMDGWKECYELEVEGTSQNHIVFADAEKVKVVPESEYQKVKSQYTANFIFK